MITIEIKHRHTGAVDWAECERFFRHVEITSACWTWVGAQSPAGYGQLKVCGQLIAAHRFVYESLVRDIPSDRVLDHLCRHRDCVNPMHLEAVSNRENILRGVSPSAKNARKTHCSNGHALTTDNVYLHCSRTATARQCRECNRRKLRKRRRVLKDIRRSAEEQST